MTVAWKPPPRVALTLLDSRPLAACLVRPADYLFYNWQTTGWEAPFAAATHLRALARMDGNAASLFGPVQYLDLGDPLLSRTDVAALIVAVNRDGSPIAVVDVWTLPSPTPSPVVGGFLRG